MPVKVGTLITNLAKKAGYDISQLAIPVDQFDLPDELEASLNTKLFTEDAAKNSQTLKSYFFKQALDGVDNGLGRLMEEFQFDENTRAELSGIKSTYDRVPALAKKIQELESQKSGATKGDKAALTEQINKLNQEKAALLADKDTEISKMRVQFESENTDFMIRNGINTANLVTEQFDKEVMADLAHKYLNSELTTQGAKVIIRNGALKLVRASDEALDFYADNKAVNFPEFLDSVLAKYKLIAVTKPVTQPGPTNIQPNTIVPLSRPVNTSFSKQLEQAKADMARM